MYVIVSVFLSLSLHVVVIRCLFHVVLVSVIAQDTVLLVLSVSFAQSNTRELQRKSPTNTPEDPVLIWKKLELAKVRLTL